MMGMFPIAGPPSTGGGGGSGINVLPLEYINIDPSSGFTKLEPDAMGYEVAHNAGTGVTTFTMDALDPGNAAYSFTGTGAEYPRSSKLLVDSAGTTMTTADSFIMAVRFSLFDNTVPANADLRMGVGLCLDPTATTTGAFDGYGITLRTVSGSRKGGIVKMDGGSAFMSTTSQSGNTVVYGQIIRSARKNPLLLAYGETSGQMPSNSYVDSTSTVELAATTNWSLWVAVTIATTSGTIDASETFAVKMDYQIIRLS